MATRRQRPSDDRRMATRDRQPPSRARRAPEKMSEERIETVKGFFVRLFLFLVIAILMINIVPLSDAIPLNGFKKDRKVKLVSLSGGAAMYPANVMESFNEAASEGIMVFSVCVYLTSDNVFVVSDTDELDTFTDAPLGTRITQCTFEQVSSYNFAYNFAGMDGDYPFRGRPLTCARLDDLFMNFAYTDFIVEVGESGRDEAACAILIELVRVNGLSTRVAIRGSSQFVSRAISNTSVTLLAGATSSELKTYSRLNSVFLTRLYGSLNFQHAEIPVSELGSYSKRSLKSLSKRNVSVFITQVNTKEELERALSYDPDGVVTSDPSYIAGLLNSQYEEGAD